MGAAMPHFKDLQAPIRMTIDEMDLSSVEHSDSDPDYEAEDPSTSSDEVEVNIRLYWLTRRCFTLQPTQPQRGQKTP